MDFKKLLNTIDSVQTRPETPSAPVLPTAVQLNEDAQLRVLSGRTTYVAEAKKKAEDDKKEEAVKEEMKVGDSKKTAKGGTVTKTKTGIVHKAGPGSYGGSDDKDTDPDADDEPKAKKAKKESIDADAFKGKFAKMVEAKKEDKKDAKKKEVKEAAKPDFLDIDKDGDKKEPMKKAASDKGSDKKDGKKGMSDKQAKYFGKKVDEAKKDHIPDRGYDGDLEEPYGKKSKPDPKGHLNKLLRKRLGEPEKKTESKMMPKGKKRPVKESVEGKLTFKEMIKLVQESGGQQQIDPVDTALFTWAQRVAAAKFTESAKQEVYAGLIYERNGGVFEMYDVLAETK
jgi:hypothetical protein